MLYSWSDTIKARCSRRAKSGCKNGLIGPHDRTSSLCSETNTMVSRRPCITSLTPAIWSVFINMHDQRYTLHDSQGACTFLVCLHSVFLELAQCSSIGSKYPLPAAANELWPKVVCCIECHCWSFSISLICLYEGSRGSCTKQSTTCPQ